MPPGDPRSLIMALARLHGTDPSSQRAHPDTPLAAQSRPQPLQLWEFPGAPLSIADFLQQSFVQDTLRATFPDIQPSVRDMQSPEELGPYAGMANRVAAFTLPNVDPSEVILSNLFASEDIPGTFAHEFAHVAYDTSENPAFQALTQELDKIYHTKMEGFDFDSAPYQQQVVLQSRAEHHAYAFQYALDWIRHGGSEEELHLMEDLVPGVGLVAEYIQSQLDANLHGTTLEFLR